MVKLSVENKWENIRQEMDDARKKWKKLRQKIRAKLLWCRGRFLGCATSPLQVMSRTNRDDAVPASRSSPAVLRDRCGSCGQTGCPQFGYVK